MTVKVGINGFGRIGRLILRIGIKESDMEFVAINPADPKTAAHLLKHDSVHGTFNASVEAGEDSIIADGKEIKVISERNDPANLPWNELGVDIVAECSGLYRDRESASKHITAGAKKVLISAAGKQPDVTIVMGVNDNLYDPAAHNIVSNASCTTNCLAPVAKVMNDSFGIVRGLMTTVHAYTNDQRILDHRHKDLRRARTAGVSLIPTTTGAAKAVTVVLPELQGKIHGIAIRVPPPNVSLVDFVADLEKDVTAEEVNKAFDDAANGPLKGILGVSYEPLVSIDFNGSPLSSIVDAEYTNVIGGSMVKVLSWYDNEYGYACRMIDMLKMMSKGL